MPGTLLPEVSPSSDQAGPPWSQFLVRTPRQTDSAHVPLAQASSASTLPNRMIISSPRVPFHSLLSFDAVIPRFVPIERPLLQIDLRAVKIRKSRESVIAPYIILLCECNRCK